jgi:hypothetical protein
MRRKRLAPHVTATIYMELGVSNAVDHIGDRKRWSRSETVNRLLKLGIGTLASEQSRVPGAEDVGQVVADQAAGAP